jgi:hypothetical protein
MIKPMMKTPVASRLLPQYLSEDNVQKDCDAAASVSFGPSPMS